VLKKSMFAGYAAWLVLSVAVAGAGKSDVADAVQSGDKASLRALLAQHVDVNAPQADGTTALHWAIYRNDPEAADLLIRSGANASAATRLGVTPLSMASLYGYAPLTERLVKAGADVNGRSPNGETPLMFASRNGNADAVKALLAAGADINATETLRGTSALMWASDQGHAAAVQLLVDAGADVNARSKTAETVVTLLISPTAKIKGDSVLAKRLAARPGILLEDRDPYAGALTPLVYAARRNSVDTVRALLAGHANVNGVTGSGWSPLLVATQNRYYKLGMFLLEHGADPNLAARNGWTPLYLAVDNRNIEHGDYPWPKPDLDHLDFIKALLDRGANVNARVKDSTETRTVFTQQWLFENGATPFLRAAQSSDLVVMKLLMAHGADPKIPTELDVTALAVAAGVGWTEGVTYEWSERDNLAAVKMLLDLGIDPNVVSMEGRTAMHGAAHKGRNAIVQLLVDHGARLDIRDNGNSDNRGGKLAKHTWLPIDYADGLVRVGTQSPIPHPETAVLIRELMVKQGLVPPPPGRTLETVCTIEACD
jgi:ankyrin repeat protein